MAVRRSGGILFLALFTLGPVIGCADAGANPGPQERIAARPVLPEHLAQLTGTASCSARGCHGALASLKAPDSTVLQDEYTKWLTHDKHANAYLVLFGERSKDIIHHLGEKKAAHENDRCLVCHTNGLTEAALQSSQAAHYREEATFGVGCETCHGGAEKWLGPHTRPGWKTAGNRLGMLDTDNPALLAMECVKCHVGSPGRDVNHDLIAAGHPRLNFELTAYLADLPAHNDLARARRTTAVPAARTWELGQAITSQAALTLLSHRATLAAKDQAPWPEFTEYDCFACHHDLQAVSWRQKRGYGPTPGALPWGTWYFALTPALSLDELGGNTFANAHAELQKQMSQPYPDPGMTAKLSSAALQPLTTWRDEVVKRPLTSTLIDGRLQTLRQRGAKLTDSGWDGAAQVYLALDALRGPLPQRKDLRQALRFPVGAGQRFDSPRTFDPDAIKKLLDTVK